MTQAEKKRVFELTKEINSLKKHLTEDSAKMSNGVTDEELKYLGSLLAEKNELTGLNEDAPFLYFDDGEWFREIKGFVGDDSGMTDCNGVRLKIGDTVLLNEYPRLVMHDLPSQDSIQECHGKKIKDYSEMDIKDAFSYAFTISHRSSLKEYEESLEHGMEMKL